MNNNLFYQKRYLIFMAAILSILLLQSCASFSSDATQTQTQPKPVTHYATEKSFTAPVGLWPAEAWWSEYGDAQLNMLISEALVGSPTLAVTSARLKRAQAYMDTAQAALLPQVSVGTALTQQKQSYNYLSPPTATPHGWNDYGRASLDVSWELDFFGRNRAALAAVTSEAEAARADLAQARLTLSTSIALAYAEFTRLFAALDTAQAALKVRTTTASLFEQRFRNGLETLGSLRQAESRRASAQVDVASLEEQLALQRNRIAALLGAGPDRGLTINRPEIVLTQSFNLPTQLSANLLGRRPDLVAARLRAEAATKRIGQAEAAFYPNVNLAAFIGVQSLGIDMLTKEGSTIGSVGPAISLPVFNGGRLRGQLRGARADYEEAVANYDRTLVQALQDVADATISYQSIDREITASNAAVDAAREAWRLQQNRYQGGIAAYLDVLSAEDYLLSTERVQTELASRSFALDITLKRALGGGFVNSNSNTNSNFSF